MKQLFLSSFFVLGLILFVSVVNAQTSIVERGKVKARIITTNDKTDIQAAELLQDFVKRISGAELAILYKGTPSKNDIVIGDNDYNKSIDKNSLKYDGFRLVNKEGVLQIVSGGGKGVLYAVVTLLENYLGVGYWGENEYSFTKTNTISLPKIDLIDNPAFRYRQSQNYAMQNDSIYKIWNRLNSPDEVFAANYWVHTFDKLLPSARYGEEHPEYYSYFKGNGIQAKQVNGVLLIPKYWRS